MDRLAKGKMMILPTNALIVAALSLVIGEASAAPDEARVLAAVRKAYPDLREMFDSGAVHRSDAVNETQLMAMLAAGRMDQILINKAVAQYYILLVPKCHEFVLGDVFGSYDVSMRVHPNKKALLPTLDEAIVTMKRSGAIARIYAKYGASL